MVPQQMSSGQNFVLNDVIYYIEYRWVGDLYSFRCIKYELFLWWEKILVILQCFLIKIKRTVIRLIGQQVDPGADAPPKHSWANLLAELWFQLIMH